MKNSKQYLDDLQEASIKAAGKKKNPPQLPQIVEIRRSLHLYWDEVANFMQVECYQTVNEVACLQDAKEPSQLIGAIKELEISGKKCSVKAKALVGQHDAFIRSFTARNIRFQGSDGIIARFTQACGALRAGLIDLFGLIEKQRQACAAYQTTASTNYNPAMLVEITRIGKQWKLYAVNTRETYTHIHKLSEDMKQPMISKGGKGGCIIM